MAKQIVEFNKISEKLAAHLESRLEQYGQWVRFQLQNGKEESVPTGQTGQEGKPILETRILYPGATVLRCNETIMDPGTKKSVRIAAVSHYDNEDNAVFYRKYIDGNAKGKFVLNANDVEGLAWVNYLLLSNHNGSNPFRDQNAEIWFLEVDEVKEAENNTREIDEELAAALMAKKMSAEDRVSFAASMGWDESMAPKLLENRVRQFAKENAHEFLELQASQDFSLKADLKKAISAGIVTYNQPNNSIHWANGDIVAKLDNTGNGYLSDFCDWANATQKGPDVVSTIRGLLNGKKPAGKAKKDE